MTEEATSTTPTQTVNVTAHPDHASNSNFWSLIQAFINIGAMVAIQFTSPAVGQEIATGVAIETKVLPVVVDAIQK